MDKYGVLENKNGIGINETNFDTNLDTNNINIDTNRNNTHTELILHLIQLNPKIIQKEIMEKTNISLSTVKRIMAKLQKEGKIRRKGSNRFGEWIIEK